MRSRDAPNQGQPHEPKYDNPAFQRLEWMFFSAGDVQLAIGSRTLKQKVRFKKKIILITVMNKSIRCFRLLHRRIN